jgi:hypothetical protein
MILIILKTTPPDLVGLFLFSAFLTIEGEQPPCKRSVVGSNPSEGFFIKPGGFGEYHSVIKALPALWQGFMFL